MKVLSLWGCIRMRALCLLFSGFFCLAAGGGTLAPARASVDAILQLGQKATPFSSSQGRFHIVLPPGYPRFKYLKKIVTNKEGGKLGTHILTSTGPNGNACLVSFADLPAASFKGRTLQQLFQQYLDGGIRDQNGTVEKQRSIRVQGYPGLSSRNSILRGGTLFHARVDLVLVRPRLYQVMFVSSNKHDLEKGEIQAYFQSFRLLP